MNPKVNISGLLLVFFSALVWAILTYAFYSTELRQKLEDLLYDVRSMLKPQLQANSQVAVVTIDDNDLANLGEDTKAFPAWVLIDLLEAILASGAKAVALVLSHQDYEYEDGSLLPLADFMQSHRNVFWGVFDVHNSESSSELLPSIFTGLIPQVGSVATFRKYDQAVLRKYPLFSYLGRSLQTQLLTHLAITYSDAQNKKHLGIALNNALTRYYQQRSELRDELPSFLINYWDNSRFTALSSLRILAANRAPSLEGKLVIVGYTSFRSSNNSYSEGSHVNTPWEGETGAKRFARPLVYVMAVFLDNLLTLSWLKPVPVLANVIQTVVFSLLSFALLSLSPALGVVLYLVAMALLFVGHGLLYSIFSLSIPLADTVLFSFFSAILSTFLKSRKAAHRRALHEQQVRIQGEIAQMQGHFLNQFAFELLDINQTVQQRLEPHIGQTDTPQLEQTLAKAMTSCEELGHYLTGIAQYSLLQKGLGDAVKKQVFCTVPLFARILNQFETQIHTKKLLVTTHIAGKALWVVSDQVLLEPIVFNLVSNAIKYSSAGGRVAISCSVYGRKGVIIRVRDEGCGIPEALQRLVFQKFYRVCNDSAHRVKGNGLGLYLCHYFAVKIGATIELDSVSGEGSQFSLIIEKG